MGVRLKRLREERGISQIELARAIEISPSYLNQIERNQRPLTVQVLLRLNSAFGIDVQTFSEDNEARLITDIKELFSDNSLDEKITLAEIKELASNMPVVARTLLKLSRQNRDTREREEAMAAKLGLDRSETTGNKPMAFEEVRDFFYSRHNHIAELDDIAEKLANDLGLRQGMIAEGLENHLWNKHKITIMRAMLDEIRRKAGSV